MKRYFSLILLCSLMAFSSIASAYKFVPPSYPDKLKASNWTKSKGGFARLLTGKSGIKGAMEDAEKASKDIDWSKIKIPSMKAVKEGGIETIEEYREAAKQEHADNVEALRKEVKKIIPLVDAEYEKYEKKTGLGNYRKLLQEVKSAADAYQLKLAGNSDTMKDAMDDFDELKEKWQEQRDMVKKAAMKNIKKTIKKAEDFIKDVEKDDYSADTFNSGIMRAARDISQNIINIKKFKTWEEEDPSELADRIDPWANGKEDVDKKAEPSEVEEKLEEFSGLVGDIEKWYKKEK